MPNLVRWGPSIAVNSQTAGGQLKPSSIGLADGTFLVVWQTDSTSADGSLGAVKGQRFAVSGAPIGSEFLVNTAAAGSQLNVRAAGLQSGGFVLTWETSDPLQDGSGTAVKAQLFDASGVKIGAEFLVNSQTYLNQQLPTVASLSDGGFIIAWQTSDPAQDGAGGAAKAQRFDSAGVKVGAEFLVNTTAFGTQNDIDIVGLSNGGFVVSWQTGSGATADIFARAYDSAGVALGNQFMVSTDYGSQNGGRLAALPGGGFVATWSTLGGSVAGIRGAIYDSGAVKVGAEFAVNTSAGSGNRPDVVALGDGGFVVSWDYSTGVRAQQFTGAGVKVGSEQLVATQASTILGDVALAALSGGGYVVAWNQTPYSGGTGFDIRAQRYLPDTTPNAAPELGAPTLALTRAENATAVATFTAVDDNAPQALTYSISGGVDASVFHIDAVTGALRFIATPNFEAPTDADRNNVYEVTVRASDGAASDTQAVTITVTNVNDAPVITSNGGTASASISLVENGTAVTTVRATDPEGGSVTYSISGGNDSTRFTINPSTGVVSFITAPNFEAPHDADHNNSYMIHVRASDGALYSTQLLFIYVTNQNEAPVITSNGGGATASISIGENNTAVTTIASTDPENSVRTYAISGGADAARFVINASTGALGFAAAPDYEAPADADANNVYQVTISASDGSLVDTQALSVTVTNVVEGVTITSDGGGDSAALSLDENGTAVTTVAAVNGEAGAPTYAIAGGADAALFVIDPASGALSFGSAPDFELPGDADGDNVYEVIVSAGNGTYSDSQALAVTILDVAEEPEGFGQLDGAAFATGSDADRSGPDVYLAPSGGADDLSSPAFAG
jgi:hypothetical protein